MLWIAGALGGVAAAAGVDTAVAATTEIRYPYVGMFGTPDTLRITAAELARDYPHFELPSTGVHPDQWYRSYWRDKRNRYQRDQFGSEGGKDSWYQIAALLQRQHNDQLSPPDAPRDTALSKIDSLRSQLLMLFNVVNQAFDCIADGGTMYGHTQSRIPAYVEYALGKGMARRYTARHPHTIAQLQQKMRTIGMAYRSKPRDELETCIPLIEFAKPDYLDWIVEQVWDFTVQQYAP